MAGTDDLLGVDAHVERIVAGVHPLPDFPLPLMDALGMAVAEDVVADQPLPFTDNAATDGYAVRRADVADASPGHPVELPVVGEVHPGRAPHLALSPGTAVRIGAGAPVPSGADCVVPLSSTDAGVVRVLIERPEPVGGNVRRAGGDVAQGDVVLSTGTVLGPRHLGLLAALGRAQVRSRPRPRVVVISTGAELRDPGTPLTHDTVHDGNSYLLAAAARACGATVYRVGILPDDVRHFSEALSDQLVRADLVITSGGTSDGRYDVVREALGHLSPGHLSPGHLSPGHASLAPAPGDAGPDGSDRVWFGRVALAPGAEQGFGHVGEDRVPIFCLPGDPVAAYASFQAFVVPALRTMMGKNPVQRPTRRARLTHRLSSTPGVRELVCGTYGSDRGGVYFTPTGMAGAQTSGDLAASNAMVVLGEDVAGVSAGEMVQVWHLDEEF